MNVNLCSGETRGGEGEGEFKGKERDYGCDHGYEDDGMNSGGDGWEEIDKGEVEKKNGVGNE